MAFGIKFVPLAPGGHCQPSPVSFTSEKDTDLSNLKQIDYELYKKELIALRERDMAITSPTQPEYFARHHQPCVQITFPSPWSDAHGFDYGYDVFIDPYSDYDMSLYTSPASIECDAWDTTVAGGSYHLDVNEFFQHQSLHPEDLATASDLWDLYQRVLEHCVSSTVLDSTEDMISIDDELLAPTEVDLNLDSTIATPLTCDADCSLSSTNSTSSDPSIPTWQEC